MVMIFKRYITYKKPYKKLRDFASNDVLIVTKKR